MDKRSIRLLLNAVLAIVVVFLLSQIQLVRADSETAYAATNNGVFKSTDGGASWVSVNAGILGHTFSLAIDPTHPETVYAGTLGEGVFKTTDGGVTWLPAGLAKTVIEKLALDPNDSNTIYASIWGSMYFSGNVFKSADGGGNWVAADAGLPGSVATELTTDSSNPAVLYAGTNFSGVFKTTNGGASWTPANAGLKNTYVSGLTVDPADPTTVYLGISGCSFNCANPAGFFKSTDGGISWAGFTTGLTDLQVVSLAVDPMDTRVLYAGARLHGLFKSVDAGLTWTSINRNLRPTMFVSDHFPLIADPVIAGTVYAGTTDGVFKSTDSGINWTASNNGLPTGTKVFALALEPASAPTIESLLAQIEELDLEPQVRSILISELNAAQAAADRGRLRAAQYQLQTLISEVAALRQSGHLDPVTADSIIASAGSIVEDLTLASKFHVRRTERSSPASP